VVNTWPRAIASLVTMRWRESLPRYLALVLTLALTALAWLGLSTLVAPFMQGVGPAGTSVSVMSERNGTAFPLRHAEAIAAIDGVATTSQMAVLAVGCRPPDGWATLNGWGGPGTHDVLASRGVSESMVAAWAAEESGVIVGDRLAERCGWQAGMKVQPHSLLGQRVPLRIIGIIAGQDGYGSQVALAHHAWVARHLPPEQQAHAWLVSVQPTNPREASELAGRIQAAFAAETTPLVATASGDADGALARFGNVQRLLLIVAAAFSACTALVFCSVLAHMAVQRRRTMAMLLALGFRHGQLQLAFSLEVLLVLALGVGVGWLLAIPGVELLNQHLGALLGSLIIPAGSTAWMIPGLLALLALSLPLPLATMHRLEPVDARAH